MPLVRITGWQRSLCPDLPPRSLPALFVKETGMDGSDAEAAIRRLMKGKFVDASFDVREDRAAKAFMREVAAFGLTAELYQDEPLSWSGSRPRPWFIKCALGVLVGFGICLWFYISWPNAIITKVLAYAEGLFIVSWLLAGAWDGRPKTAEQEKREKKLRLWWRLGPFVLIVLIGSIIAEPLVGVILLMLALGGIGCAFLIRLMNRD